MRQSLTLLAAGIVAVHAQVASLPQCGQTCVTNMLDIAVQNFGCDANNDLAACACCNADFGFGIRDCSQASCGDGTEDYSSVISYGSSYCASAASTCPSGTQATSVLATATDGGSNTTTSASMSTPAMTSGANSSSSSMSMSMSSGSGAGGALGAQVSNVRGSPNAYVVDGSIISAGGNQYTNGDGTTYTALPSAQGVLVAADGTSTTANPGQQGGVITIDPIAINPSGGSVMSTSSASSGGSGGSGGNSGNSGNSNSGGSSSSSSSGNFAPIQTAAPALIGAAAMAILAL